MVIATGEGGRGDKRFLHAIPSNLRDFAPRRLNVWQKTAKDHDRTRLPGTLGLVERSHVSEMRSLYMQ